MMQEDMTRLSIDISKDLHKLIKHSATFEDQSIKDFVISAIENKLKARPPQQRELNELTARTLEEADRGEELHRYESFKAFLVEMDEDENEDTDV